MSVAWDERDVRIYVGPQRGDVELPVINEGTDWLPPSPWIEVTDDIASVSGSFADHESELRLEFSDRITDSDTFPPDRQVLARARYWDEVLLGYTPFVVIFLGYVTGEMGGDASWDMNGQVQQGQIVCRQEWHYLSRSSMPPLRFGQTNIAAGKSATAGPNPPQTLTDPLLESGIEYLGSQPVGPEQAVDESIDTCWVSDDVCEAQPVVQWSTGNMLKFTEVYSGRQPSVEVGANGRPLWIEITAANIQYQNGFEINTAGWEGHNGAKVNRLAAPFVHTGAWSLICTGGGSPPWYDNPIPLANNKEPGCFYRVQGLQPEVECEVRFWIKAHTADAVVELTLGGGLSEGDSQNHVLRIPESHWTPFIYRYPVAKSGAMTLRFNFSQENVGNGAKGFHLDDVQVTSGVDFREGGQPYRFAHLIWEDGLGHSGDVDLGREFDIGVLGGNRSLILADDADLFRDFFDAGQDHTVVQFRDVPALRDMSFISGRGRLRLIFARGNWPAPTSPPAVTWDDINFATMPIFTATQSLARNEVGTWVVRNNPAPGGTADTGMMYLQVDLGQYPSPSLEVSLSASAGDNQVIVSSTDRFPIYGHIWIDNERMAITKVSPTTFSAVRDAPAPHAIGALIYPDLNGLRNTHPLVSAVGFTRRAGTPILVDYDIIGSTQNTPSDPSVETEDGLKWGAHPDWFPLATGRGNQDSNVLWQVSGEGPPRQVPWPPPSGWSASWGKPVRFLAIVGSTMQRWHGKPQRMKINTVLAYLADQGAGVAGGYKSMEPPDLRGVVGHLLVERFGLNPARLIIDKGEAAAPNLTWGYGYGELLMAGGTISEALTGLEAKGLLRVTVRPTGIVVVAPNPFTTSASFALTPERTWDRNTMTKFRMDRKARHEVGQIKISAFQASTGMMFKASYPKQPQKLGAVVDVSDLILGTRESAEQQAVREFRQRNAGYTVGADTMAGYLPTPWSRHLINFPEGDWAGVEVAGLNCLLIGYSWRLNKDPNGSVYSLSLSFQELRPY